MWKPFALVAVLLVGSIPAIAAADGTVSVPIPVQVMVVKQTLIPVYASYPGTIVPSEYIQVASRLSGYVRNIKVGVGQSVRKGDLLLTVDPTAVSAGVQQARSQVNKAHAALQTARDNYDRFKALYTQHAVPKQRFQQVELGYKAAKSDYRATQAGLRSALNQIAYAEIRAPFDGVVFSKTISNGQLIAPGHELMVLYNPKQLQVDVEVGDAAYYYLKRGEPVPVDYIGPDQVSHQVQTIVSNLVAASNPVTHTHTVKLLLPAGTSAQGGEYARVMIPVQQQSVVLVPIAAVQVRAGITGAFVVDKAGEAEFRMLTLGARRGEQRVILSGLFPGDRLIVRPQGELANGVKVKASGDDGA